MTQLIDIRACGIPAKAHIIHATYAKPCPGTWDSDWDHDGGWHLDWELCDRRGRPAPWLRRKVTDRELNRIEDQIIKALETRH